MKGKILVACEESQMITKVLRYRGLEAYSCDLLPCSGGFERWHIQSDAIKEAYSGKYIMMIAHPPCTYLSVAGNKWMHPKFKNRFPNRAKKRKQAIKFFLQLYFAPIPMVAVENPVGIISTHFRKPDQYVQPYQFGDPHSKKTGWWLRGLPKLKPTKIVKPIWQQGKNGTRHAKWYLDALSLPADERSKVRSKTFPGMAIAIANQWGSCINSEVKIAA